MTKKMNGKKNLNLIFKEEIKIKNIFLHSFLKYLFFGDEYIYNYFLFKNIY